MSDTVTAPPPKPVPNWALAGFLIYFAAILPLFAWGLWNLIAKNTVPILDSAPLTALRATSLRADTLAYLSAYGQTRLVMDQGELILAVILAGGIGSYIHGVNSFVTYVGNRSFVNSWTPWYILRPFMGIGMAVIFYVVVRGGVLVMTGGENTVDPYAMMTVAALAGMFSKQASDKLAEVFDTLFRSRADQERGDKLEKPELKLASITPAEAKAASGDTVVTATGTGFVAESIVRFDKADRKPAFKSPTELTFTLAAAELATPGEHTVAIFNPAAGGTTSNELKFTVTAAVPVERIITAGENGQLEVVAETGATNTVGTGAGETGAGNGGEADANGAVG